MRRLLAEGLRKNVRDSIASHAITASPYNMVGPTFANVHSVAAKIKKDLDPNNVANPTRLVDMEALGKGSR